MLSSSLSRLSRIAVALLAAPAAVPAVNATDLTDSQTYATLALVERYTAQAGTTQVVREELDASETVTFRRNAERGFYSIRIPDFAYGRLRKDIYPASLLLGNNENDEPVRVYLNPHGRGDSGIRLTYTGFGTWLGRTDLEGGAARVNEGLFSYGVATLDQQMPTTGRAVYSAYIRGHAQFDVVGGLGYDVGGTARLAFNFSTGTLRGWVRPWLEDAWGYLPLGTYRFRDTVYRRGSTVFSGKFDTGEMEGDAWFNGRFTGPDASELMARFTAPLIDPYSFEQGQLMGVMVGYVDDRPIETGD